MNKAQSQQYQMMLRVQKVYYDNTLAINVFNALNADYLQFDAWVKDILQLDPPTQKNNEGLTKDKEGFRKALCAKAEVICGNVSAFAAKTNNNALAEQVKFTLDKLLKTPQKSLVSVCINIKKAANDNLAALKDYNIVAQTLTDFQKDIDNFNAALPKRQNANDNKAADRKILAAHFKKINNLLKNSIDKQMVNFKSSNPKLYQTYIAARDIKGNGGNDNPPIKEEGTAPKK